MSKFALMSEDKITKQQFNFKIGETLKHHDIIDVTHASYCIIDVNSNMGQEFALLDGVDTICVQMNRDQSWGPWEPKYIESYRLI